MPKRGGLYKRATSRTSHAEAGDRINKKRKLEAGCEKTANVSTITRGRGRGRGGGSGRGRGSGKGKGSDSAKDLPAPAKKGAKTGPKNYFDSTAVATKKPTATEIQLQPIPPQRVRELLAQLPVRHAVERGGLRQRQEAHFPHWKDHLRCGYSLLFYGMGSKKDLLESFATSTLVDGAVVVVNGYFPSLSVKEVIQTVAGTLGVGTEEELKWLSIQQLLIKAKGAKAGMRCYLVVNNIDGTSLRSSEVQVLLAELSGLESVHLIASIDHINAPLLWDKKLLACFNWMWCEADTFAPYAAETAHVPLVIGGMAEERQVRGAANVLKSLTSNSRAIFKVLANMHTTNQEEPGVSFSKLYLRCREEFLASSELTLKGHLTEFCDHQLVRQKRGNDGQEMLHIPMSSESIKLLLAEVDQS